MTMPAILPPPVDVTIRCQGRLHRITVSATGALTLHGHHYKPGLAVELCRDIAGHRRIPCEDAKTWLLAKGDPHTTVHSTRAAHDWRKRADKLRRARASARQLRPVLTNTVARFCQLRYSHLMNNRGTEFRDMTTAPENLKHWDPSWFRSRGVLVPWDVILKHQLRPQHQLLPPALNLGSKLGRYQPDAIWYDNATSQSYSAYLVERQNNLGFLFVTQSWNGKTSFRKLGDKPWKPKKNSAQP